MGRLGTSSGKPELGYWVGKPRWGQGIAPEAAREIMRHAFDDLGVRILWCACDDTNGKSKRVMEKCGFEHSHTVEGVISEYFDDLRAEHFTHLTRERWLTQRAACGSDRQEEDSPCKDQAS